MDDETGAWSASRPSVREALQSVAETDARAVVATVTAVEGSAYRRPGAKRVLTDSEAISGGETVADLAERALADGPLCETFDLTGEVDALGVGLGYNGVVTVLVEPADGSFRPALERVAAGESAALLTVVGGERPDAPVGARAVVNDDGGTVTADSRTPLPGDVLAAVGERATEFAASGHSDTVAVDTDAGTVDVFVDGLEPAPELFVFGRDGDVKPVARFGRDVGFRVTVAIPDGRETDATPRGSGTDAERFPAAHDVVAVAPSEVAEAVSRPDDTYAVLMSHDFTADRLALESLLETELPYVGLMGPRKRFEAMREALADGGVELPAADRDRIASPVGLDLGGGDPAQIALAVVAEALAASNGRDGGRLTDGAEPIHPRSGFGSESPGASDFPTTDGNRDSCREDS